MQILAIETSCDETAVALLKTERDNFFVVDECISSQTKTHAPFGGVVPNLAARDHLKNLPLLIKKIILKNKVGKNNIDLIAVTQGPGLIPALLIGTNAAKALAYAWKKPLVGVHHIAGHIYANFLFNQSLTFSFSFRELNSRNSSKPSFMEFPILALIVSGGHTELILMKKHLSYKIIGQTLDDAAGEAFDKAAKILKLGYPGGPLIAKLAKLYQSSTFPLQQTSRCNFSKSSFSLPRPMLNSGNFNFSFSGLKTALLYTIRDNPEILKNKKMIIELCAEFQQAVIDVLIHKTITAAKKYQPKTILLGGGVSANKELRKQLGKAIKDVFPNISYSIPDTKYSLDNAAMIAVAGYYRYKLSKNKTPFHTNWKKLEAEANLKL